MDRQRERLYEFSRMTSARNIVLTTLYGKPKTIQPISSMVNTFKKDPRITPFITTVAARERELWVDNYRAHEQSNIPVITSNDSEQQSS